MRETFLEHHGHDVAAHLPSLLANVGDYRRIRCDYWHYLTGRLESAYYRQCAEWCREHGLTLTGHLSGEELFRHNILFFGDLYRCLRWLDIPGIDAIFPRLNHEADHFMVAAKSGGSAIRQLGRDRLLCETYTGSGWELTPEQMKIIFDKLALGGVLEECPDVRVVWSHCGGGLAMVLDRIDRGYRRYEGCLCPPSEYLRRCYYDTVTVSGPALECARATFGADRLVYGTDEPHVPNGSKAVLQALRERPWPEAEMGAILGGTACGLLEG
jgi:hypothetical protein